MYSADGTHQLGVIDYDKSKVQFLYNYVLNSNNNKPAPGDFRNRECWFTDIQADGYSDGVNWFVNGIIAGSVSTQSNFVVINELSELSTISSYYTTAFVKDSINGGNFNWSSTGTVDNGITFAGSTGYWDRIYSGAIKPSWFGAVGDGTTDDTAALILALAALQSGMTLDLDGLSYVIYTGVAGSSYPVDAIALNGCLRLYNKSNIEIKNGTIFAHSPSVSTPVLSYPSTFTLDGCTNIKLTDLTLRSKGQSYGDADSSYSLNAEQRRVFLAQNGGHALLVIRSKGVYIDNVRTELCGSCGVFYITSSDDVVATNCYSTAESLGYAAYALDGWCGSPATAGYTKFELTLLNCICDANGATYGNKCGLAIEDAGSIARVIGGVYKDCYANAGTHELGSAFICGSGGELYVTGGTQVDNCAAVTRSGGQLDPCYVFVSDLVATNLRTSMHIERISGVSLPGTVATYKGCYFEVIGTSLWSEVELAQSSIVANMRGGSGFNIDLIDCVSVGASVLSINSNVCYGGIKVQGGEHTMVNRIFDSVGWGGVAAGSFRGFDLKGTILNITSATPSTANAFANTAAIVITNVLSGSYCYMYIDFDSTTMIRGMTAFLNAAAISVAGSGLVERSILAQVNNNCWQDWPNGHSSTGRVKVIAYNGDTGTYIKLTLEFTDGKLFVGSMTDDNHALRELISSYGSLDVSTGKLRANYYITSITNSFTINGIYPVLSIN